YMADSEPALAEDLLRPAVQAHASDLALQLDFARVLDSRGKSDEARKVTEALVRAQPKNLEFLQSAARSALSAKDIHSAEKYVDQLRQTYPQHPLGYYYAA